MVKQDHRCQVTGNGATAAKASERHAAPLPVFSFHSKLAPEDVGA